MTSTEIYLIVYLLGAILGFFWLVTLVFEFRENAKAMKEREQRQAERRLRLIVGNSYLRKG